MISHRFLFSSTVISTYDGDKSALSQSFLHSTCKSIVCRISHSPTEAIEATRNGSSSIAVIILPNLESCIMEQVSHLGESIDSAVLFNSTIHLVPSCQRKPPKSVTYFQSVLNCPFAFVEQHTVSRSLQFFKQVLNVSLRKFISTDTVFPSLEELVSVRECTILHLSVLLPSLFLWCIVIVTSSFCMLQRLVVVPSLKFLLILLQALMIALHLCTMVLNISPSERILYYQSNVISNDVLSTAMYAFCALSVGICLVLSVGFLMKASFICFCIIES